MTTAREVVDACADAIRRTDSEGTYDDLAPWDELDDGIDNLGAITKADTIAQALAVIRALASVGCTEQMRRVSVNRHYEHIDLTMSKVLTALADGYEREREGGG